MLLISFSSSAPIIVTTGPPAIFWLTMREPDSSFTTHPKYLPSGDHPQQSIPSPSLLSRYFRGCSPFGPMNQISRSPCFPRLVANEIVEPSGETAQTTAWSRSFVGSPPSTENSQMLEVAELSS